MLNTAKKWIKQGIAVIPIRYKDKRPLIPWKEYQHTLPTEPELIRWFSGPPVNIAVVCGWRGLAVLDFDTTDAYDLWTAWAEMNWDLWADTYTVETARGIHVYAFLDEPTHNRPLGFMDIKSQGGYVLAPPSLHPSGWYYTDNGMPILRAKNIAEIMPAEWLVVPEPPQPIEPEPVSIWDRANAAQAPVGCTIEEIKRAIPIESLFSESWASTNGYKLVRCPLHNDHNPSMWVDTRRQICGCYAGCTPKPLDVINLYARMKNITNDEAIRELAKRV